MGYHDDNKGRKVASGHTSCAAGQAWREGVSCERVVEEPRLVRFELAVDDLKQELGDVPKSTQQYIKKYKYSF